MSLGYRCKYLSGRKAEILARHDSTLAAFTGYRPGTPLAIEYREVDLFILQNLKSEETKLVMQLRLKNTQSRLKQ